MARRIWGDVLSNNPDTSKHDEVKKHFDVLSDVYPENFSEKKSGKNFNFAKRRDIVLTLLSEQGGKLLDSASGSGEITSAVLAAGNFQSATVVDLSESMLSLAQESIEASCKDMPVEYVSANIFDFGERTTNRYDFVLCLGLIAHSGSLESLLRIYRNLLSHGGTVALQTSLLDNFGVKIVRTLTREKYIKTHGYEIHYYSIADIKKAVVNAGFEIVSFERFSLSFPFGDRIYPVGNFHLEKILEKSARNFGGEAIFHLKPIRETSRELNAE